MAPEKINWTDVVPDVDSAARRVDGCKRVCLWRIDATPQPGQQTIKRVPFIFSEALKPLKE
jgi:hypothetical protein